MKSCLDNLKNCNAGCCRNLAFIIDAKTLTEDKKKYYEYHGCKILRLSHKEVQIIIPVKCDKLTEENKCSLHGTPEKPKVCQRFGEGKTEGYYIPDKCIY